jgi:hypothetical protein
MKNHRPGYSSEYYGNIDNIHCRNLFSWAAKKGYEIFPFHNPESYLFIRLGYILDTSKE